MSRIVTIVLPELWQLSKVPREQIQVLICPEDVHMTWDNEQDRPESRGTWVLEWLRNEGDLVMDGEAIAVLVGFGGTVAIDLASSADGVLTQIVAKEGTARSGDVIAIVRTKNARTEDPHVLPFRK
jgi:hypothetical protein